MNLIHHLILLSSTLSLVSCLISNGRQHAKSCESVKRLNVPGARTLSITSSEKHNITVPSVPGILPNSITNLSFCEVNITLTHASVHDKVLIQIWLPLHGIWNTRFVGIGGAGWAAGLGDPGLAPFVASGYAAASTDAGLSGDTYTPAAWALDAHGNVNRGLLENFASRSVHDLAMAGKAVTEMFYGRKATYTYWNGCSTGGRQGLIAAQEYPEDFDGILAGAPAIYWTEYVVAELWPQVVMNAQQVFPSLCELNGAVSAAVSACDELDGVKDGVITDLTACKFNASSIVGKEILCDGKVVKISHSTTSIIQKIWDGPRTPHGRRLWFGLQIGAPSDNLANTTIDHGKRIGAPFFIADTWARFFLKANPNFNPSTITDAGLQEILSLSTQKYSKLMDSANPDLSSFRKTGGKLLVWHGEADPIIFPQGTERYYKEVQHTMGAKADIDNFFRLFMAPGVDHCGQGTTPGAIPVDPFSALIKWVEHGKAPNWLDATAQTGEEVRFRRKVCRFPLVAKYCGGDSKESTSWECVQEKQL